MWDSYFSHRKHTYFHAPLFDELPDLIMAESREYRDGGRRGGRGIKWVDRGALGHTTSAAL